MSMTRHYTFYRPYHLASIEAPRSVGMAIINKEPGLQPSTWIAEVIGHAKKDLAKGDKIDGIGGYASYGVTYPVEQSKELVPLGLLEGAEVLEDIPTLMLDDTKQVGPQGKPSNRWQMPRKSDIRGIRVSV